MKLRFAYGDGPRPNSPVFGAKFNGIIAASQPVTQTFWIAMLLVVTGVVLGQTNWQKILGARWLPQE